MNNELSKDNWVLSLKGGVNIYITEEEKDSLESIINNQTSNLIKIKSKIIMVNSILYIVPATDIEETMRLKRGQWKCEKGHWNDRGINKCSSCYF